MLKLLLTWILLDSPPTPSSNAFHLLVKLVTSPVPEAVGPCPQLAAALPTPQALVQCTLTACREVVSLPHHMEPRPALGLLGPMDRSGSMFWDWQARV